MSVDVLNSGFDWTNAENGELVPLPIDYTFTEFNNTPAIRSYIDGGTILAGKTFRAVDAKIRVAMADPTEFVIVTLTEYGEYAQAAIAVPYVGQEGAEYVYSVDGEVLFGSAPDISAATSVYVGPSSGAEVFVGTGSYPSQAVLPLTFTVDRLNLVEDVAPSNCFWTDLVGVSQDCAEGPPPSDIAPVRDYRSFCDNGVMALEWANYDGNSPYSTAESGFGLYLSGGDWNVIANVQSYFPRDPSDRVTADLNIFRALRQNTTAVFGGDPYNFEAWAEFVGTVNLDNLSVIESDNGGVPFRIVGLAPGLPTFDPDYIYFVTAALNIYSPADDLVATYDRSGAVYDQAGEVPDADNVTKQIKLTVEVVPEEFAAFDTFLLGVGAAYEAGTGDSILFYAVGSWRGVAAEFTCSDFMAAIDGEPAVSVPTTCS